VNQALFSMPSWSFYIHGILNLLNAFSLILLFTWKRIGLYLFAGSQIVAAAVSVMLGSVNTAAIALSLGGILVSVGVLSLLMRSRWNFFN
jgi:hypothetical protein